MISSTRRCALLLGCLAAITAGAGDTTTFTYDALGRLVQAQISGGAMHGAQRAFQYDSAGNRTGLQMSGATAPHPATITPASPTLNVVNHSNAAMTLNVGGASAGGTVSISLNGVFAGTASVVGGVVHVTLQGVAPAHTRQE